MNIPTSIVPDTPDSPLAAAIERASLRAWPAVQEHVLDRWLLRFSEGYTRRANSATAYISTPSALAPQITACETLYRVHALPCVFRLASPWPQASLDAELDDRGYALRDLTHVLALRLPGDEADLQTHAVSFADSLSRWLDVYYRVSQSPRANRTAHERVLIQAGGSLVLARADSGESPAACGLGVVDGEFAGLFDIVVRTDVRREGYGYAVVTALLREARTLGARWAYLQVTDGNAAAQRLYEHHGFTEVYHYWYRQRLAGCDPS